MLTKSKIPVLALMFFMISGLFIFSSLVTALPPPPPAAPVFPGSTYNDTNTTPIDNSTSTNTTDDSDNGTATGLGDVNDSEDTNTDDYNDYVDYDYPTEDEYVSDEDADIVTLIDYVDDIIGDNVSENVSNPEYNTVPPNTGQPSGQSDQNSEDSASGNISTNSSLLIGVTSNTLSNTVGDDDIGVVSNAPSVDSPSDMGGIIDTLIDKVNGILGIISAIVLLVLVVLFTVLNRDTGSKSKNNVISVHPTMSLNQQLNYMPSHQMPPRVGPRAQQLQALQLRCQQQLFQRRKIIRYQRYLQKLRKMRSLGRQQHQHLNFEEINNDENSGAARQNAINPQSSDIFSRPKV